MEQGDGGQRRGQHLAEIFERSADQRGVGVLDDDPAVADGDLPADGRRRAGRPDPSLGMGGGVEAVERRALKILRPQRHRQFRRPVGDRRSQLRGIEAGPDMGDAAGNGADDRHEALRVGRADGGAGRKQRQGGQQECDRSHGSPPGPDVRKSEACGAGRTRAARRRR
jgi:hypothetical protein